MLQRVNHEYNLVLTRPYAHSDKWRSYNYTHIKLKSSQKLTTKEVNLAAETRTVQIQHEPLCRILQI